MLHESQSQPRLRVFVFLSLCRYLKLIYHRISLDPLHLPLWLFCIYYMSFVTFQTKIKEVPSNRDSRQVAH